MAQRCSDVLSAEWHGLLADELPDFLQLIHNPQVPTRSLLLCVDVELGFPSGGHDPGPILELEQHRPL